MKYIALIFTPAILIVIFCAVIGAVWYYYVVGWFFGVIFGLLASFVYFLVFERKSKSRIDLKRTWLSDEDGSSLFF